MYCYNSYPGKKMYNLFYKILASNNYENIPSPQPTRTKLHAHNTRFVTRYKAHKYQQTSLRSKQSTQPLVLQLSSITPPTAQFPAAAACAGPSDLGLRPRPRPLPLPRPRPAKPPHMYYQSTRSKIPLTKNLTSNE